MDTEQLKSEAEAVAVKVETEAVKSKYWPYYVMGILFIALIISVHSCQSKDVLLKQQAGAAKVYRNISSVEAGRKAVSQREEGYKQADAELATIREYRKGQRASADSVKARTRKEIQADVEKMDIDTLARELAGAGYSNSVVERK